MGKFFRISAWLLLVTALVWLTVIAYWQSAEVHPGKRDLLLYLGLLPLAIFAVLALGKLGFDGARRKAGAPADKSRDPVEAVAADAPPPEPARAIAILAGALQVPAGQEAAHVLAALSTPASPSLHDRLKDGSGFPVFAAWDRSLDVEQAHAVIEAMRDRPVTAPEASRALALLMPVAADLVATIAAHGPAAHPRDALAAMPAAVVARLQVSLFLPTDWPAALGDAARDWLADEALAAGLPAEHLAIEVLPTTSAADLWRKIAAIAQARTERAAPVQHLLLACQSMVGERSVHRLEQAGRLLSARQPEGIVPGEGAAGVVLLPGDDRDQFALPPRTLLRAQATAQRGVSWQARSATAQIAEQWQQLFDTVPGTASGDVRAVVSDADLRRSRAAAIGSALTQAAPQLEPDGDGLHTGVACGELGIVAPLALLALASAKADATGAPVVAMAVAEADQRTLALVTPPDPPVAHAADATPSTPRAA
ncbi:MAG: hypothetical protein LCH70_11720 [Proteobacteria bacterium]|nr:hypothetical protein [Pseudomonadota bacterium]